MDVVRQAMHQTDLLCVICQYLTVFDVFGAMITLNRWYYLQINGSQKFYNTIKQCLVYDFGDILNQYSIELKRQTVGTQLSKFYTEWDFLEQLHHECIAKNNVKNFTVLMALENCRCVQLWFDKVKNLFSLTISYLRCCILTYQQCRCSRLIANVMCYFIMMHV